jgi:hypothetical protein
MTDRTAVIAGLLMAMVYTASPLFVIALLLSAIVLALAGRGLPAGERRQLRIILGGALALRFLCIGAVMVSGIPWLNDLSIGALSGDDAYYLGRAIRARDVLLGLTGSRYDYFVITDEYGRTSYLELLTVLQVLFGPTPYGMAAVNAVLFVSGAAILFRVVRPAFGATASVAALIVLLLLPSLLVSSISLVKESVYFFASALLAFAVATLLRRPRPASIVFSVVLGTAALFVLADLRRGAMVLSLAGVGIALTAPLLLATRRRALITIAAAAVAVAVAWMQPPVRARILDGVTGVAKTHAGHVFTTGHAYKLLDDGFYFIPGAPSDWPIKLTDAQALRFLVRAATSFLVTPLPWEMASLRELAFLPEHTVWLLMLIFAPIGVAAGWRRDRPTTALLIGFIVPTAAALAVTTGNVGTLLRLRGLITPFLVWISALGALSVAEYLLAPAPAPRVAAEDAR